MTFILYYSKLKIKLGPGLLLRSVLRVVIGVRRCDLFMASICRVLTRQTLAWFRPSSSDVVQLMGRTTKLD